MEKLEVINLIPTNLIILERCEHKETKIHDFLLQRAGPKNSVFDFLQVILILPYSLKFRPGNNLR